MNTHPGCSGVVDKRRMTFFGQWSHLMSGNGAPTSFWASTEPGRQPFVYLPADHRRCRSERLEEEPLPTCGLVGVFRPGAQPVHGAARPPTARRAQDRPDPPQIRPAGAQTRWPWLGSSAAPRGRGWASARPSCTAAMAAAARKE